MDTQNALTVIFERNAFYRRQYLLALGALGLVLLVIGLLISIIVFLSNNPTRPIYFAADNVSRLIHIVPVDQQNMTTNEMLTWAVDAVQRTRSYDYINYRSQLQSAQKYFTTYGWQNYREAFAASNNLPGVIQRKMIVLARVVSTPKILVAGPLSGAYAWKLQMPLLVTYWSPPYDDNSKFANAFVVTMIVQRQPILQSYKGLAILQYFESTPSAPTQPQEISGTSTG